MKPILPLFLAVLLSTGCSLQPAAVQPDKDAEATVAAEVDTADKPVEPEKPAQNLPLLELTPQRLYRLTLAEIAAQRGEMGTSAVLYRDLAKETRDPRIARRATEIAMHSRDMGMALDDARLWSETEPESDSAKQALIQLLAIKGNYAELKTELATLLAAEPKFITQNLLSLGRLFGRGGDRKAILDVIETIATPYLDHAEAHYTLALAAAEAKESAKARAAIERALELRPDWENAALLRAQLAENRTVALAKLGEFVAANPQARNAHLTYARALVGEKRYKEARDEFRALLKQGGNDATKNGDAVFALAVLSLQLEDTAEAERLLRKVVDIGHPEADKARFYLGQIAEDGKRWNEAIKWFGAVGPGDSYLPARMHVAEVLSKQGKLDEARHYLADTQTDDPRERARLLIGEAQLLNDAGKPNDAYGLLAAGLERDPDQIELLYEIALMAEKIGRFEESETRLRHLLELKPDHAHALNALGFSLADRNERLGEARELIERAVELQPDDPFILDSKGWVMFRQGEAAAGLDVLKQAFALRADPEIAAHIGEVLWSLGRRDEARATWAKAQKENPANAALAETIKRLTR